MSTALDSDPETRHRLTFVDVDDAGDGDDLGWQDDALCTQTDPEAFFPEKGGSTLEAKRVCRACPVRAVCLQYALDNEERFGVWGGLSERERRRLLKRVADPRDRTHLAPDVPDVRRWAS